MLSDLTVIDASTVLAGPSVGTFFAELGARVIKIEHPAHGDVTRTWKLPSEKPDSPVSAYFASVNYGKSYLQLDLRNTDDHATFLDLIKTADILLSNFKRGDDKKLNITDTFLSSINPRLIHGKISGFGSDSDRVAYDLILQAETGFMSMNGTPESGPVKMPVALIDVLAAHQLKEGVLLALLKRTKSGKGSTVHVSLYNAAVCSLMNQASNFLMAQHVAQRIGSLHPNIAPYGELFTTEDGQTVTFAIGSNQHFQKLCAYLGLEVLLSDHRFATNQQRVVHRVELQQILQEQISTHACDTLLSGLHALFVPVGKVRSIDEVLSAKETQPLIRHEEIDGTPTARITSIAFQ